MGRGRAVHDTAATPLRNCATRDAAKATTRGGWNGSCWAPAVRRVVSLLVLATTLTALACGGDEPATKRPPIDRSGDCPTSAPASTPPPIGVDGVVYADEGDDRYFPDGELHAPVPSVVGLAASGGTVVLTRLFRGLEYSSLGVAEIVTVPADRRSDRCSVTRRWASATDGTVLGRLALRGDEVAFLDDGHPMVLPLAGGDAVRLDAGATLRVGAFAVDESSLVTVATAPSGGQRFDLRYGPRSGSSRIVGTFPGATSASMIVEDDRYAYVAAGIGGIDEQPIVAVDKRSGATTLLAGAAPGNTCTELAVTRGDPGVLWAICDRVLVRREVGSTAFANVHRLPTWGSGLVADERRAFWVEDDAITAGKKRVVSIDALGPPDTKGQLVPTILAEVTDARGVTLARDGAALYIAVESGACTSFVDVGSGRGRTSMCATDHRKVRIERRAVP